MVDSYGSPRAYSARSLECAIGEYSRSIKSNSAIGVNAGNIMVHLTWTHHIDLKDSGEDANRAIVLEYNDMSAGWPVMEKGEYVGAKSDIEFWGPLSRRLIDESFEGISCLLILIQAFYKSKRVECSTIEPVMTTSCKAFVNGCVIDSSFTQTPLREAHHICLQVQIDLFYNVCWRYTPIIKDFFSKVVLFFKHENSGKRWPLVLVQVYSVEEYNGMLVAKNGQMKPKVVHLVDVKELVGLSVEVTSRKISANTISLLKLAFNEIKEEIALFICISSSSLPVDHYELCKLKSVKSYLRHRLLGSKTLEASEKAAMEQQKPESCSTILVKKHIDEIIIPKKLGIPGSVSMSTV
ncbi:hypothetical protein PHYBLDRAFT_58535 [Phycomyces blakesleeanus NRRL 1555(-)]|uniref:Uncharacterized protein n=1 Tax=Phycomyces blakesleeanus (strain ATCC 8743b / DSM 1359 / FGSC 10004 / NBRC 33097 / NRRL 1555) TaxID=763407 RepID=A0A167QCM9_PHYB8|nr:hypothetical protein PHYBLDRAFT_58535 [Phycomyces blakesleeanus NRRL 1555(-)]OAD79487.1 hypothetical protein PHYBLDRAFT_58535 [Phycomyces blakesleeanus NRRL 1555(-)]|eukprot:XP_018297527.1 hypothetical protein PHYBLDRAFT_58535 [Phycomyces blakesleeanus NRRL 1555(-)]